MQMVRCIVALGSQERATGSSEDESFAVALLREHVAGAQVVLEGTPLVKGLFVVTGCKISSMGVTWHQPWSPPPPSPLQMLCQPASPDQAAETGGLAQARPFEQCLRLMCMSETRSVSHATNLSHRYSDWV